MPTNESSARRALRRIGLVLRKCRLRTRADPRYGRYTILDANSRVIAGNGDFDLALVGVDEFIRRRPTSIWMR
jgi:hypothetical protein